MKEFTQEEKLHKCKYCDKCFTRLSVCKTHERIHTGEKPYQCKYCDKSFSQLSNCKTHERIHTGEKLYKCKYWDECFTRLSVCKKHERIHTGVKPYRCKYCDKPFNCSSRCKRHEMIHTRKKGSKCFIRLHYLSKDKKAHPGETECQLLSTDVKQSANQLNTFSCWICQEELSSQELLLEHYDNHMILE